MGMDVNNSRLSGMDQAAHASQLNQDKRTNATANQPPADDVDEFEQLMRGESTEPKGDKPALKDGKSPLEAHSQMRDAAAQGKNATLSGKETAQGKDATQGKNATSPGKDAAHGKDSLSQGSESKMPSADNLFASMFGMQNQSVQGQANGQAAAVEMTGAVNDPDAMDSMVNKMVDRILVSDPGKGMQEVRLTFNDAALKGTEVTLSRATDGLLMVKLETSDKSSYQTLVGAQDSLRSALERTGQNVRVEANLFTDQQDNNSNQRSKGYQEYREEDEDKRS